MRLWPRHWHPETWVCSMRGHVAPAAEAAELSAEDQRLGVDLPDGGRLARCLRCDMWLRTAVPAADTARYPTLPPLAELSKPRRGKPLHDAILLRVIALDRAAHSFAFTVIAVTVLLLETNLKALHGFAQNTLSAISNPVNQTGQGAGKGFLDRELAKVLDLKPSTLKVLLVTAAIYAVVEGVEAVGLWRERRWAEYLTALATAGFLPFEVHELITRVTAVRVGALVANVAILLWLLWNKRLFGLNGGPAALEVSVDWDDVLAGSSPAPLYRSPIREEATP